MFAPSRFLTATVLLGASSLACSVARAQCQLEASTRSVALTWGTGNGDVTDYAGPLAAGPVVANAVAADNSIPREASGNMTSRMTSGYGGFRFVANGSAQKTWNGMFLNSRATGSISDSIRITSPSLPPGTPVQLRFTTTTSGTAVVNDGSPQISIDATVGPCTSQSLGGFGTASQTCVSSVGGVIGWYRSFTALLDATSLGGLGAMNSSIAADITVTYTIESLTPGVVLAACSNHSYTPPCPADVDDGTGTGSRDDGVGIEDLLYYLGLYDAGVARADVDDGSGTGTPDGGVGIEDLLYYLVRFDAGC